MNCLTLAPGAVCLYRWEKLIVLLNLLVYLADCSSSSPCSSNGLAGTIRKPCNRYFYLSRESGDFKQHKDRCIKSGGWLAQLYTQQHVGGLSRVGLSGFAQTQAYVGATGRGIASYQWINEGQINSTLWFPGFPTSDVKQDCVVIFGKDMKLRTVDCESRIYGVCEACLIIGSNVQKCRNPVACPGKAIECSNRGCPKVKYSASCDYSPCFSNRYGPACEYQCNCHYYKPCNIVTGYCPQGCLPGWFGDSCNLTECPLRRYGGTCSKFCYCAHGQQCAISNGHCSHGCPDGHKGSTCKATVCPKGKFGDSCESTCRCPLQVACAKKSGFCYTEPCPSNTFGRRCQNWCFCKGKSKCQPETGKCPKGCADGWKGPSCNQTVSCPKGYFGDTCEKRCECSFGTCDPLTGVCNSTEANKNLGFFCDNPRKWGEDCNNECQVSFCSKCLRVTGNTCAGCDDGYVLEAGICVQPGMGTENILIIVVMLILFLLLLLLLVAFLLKKRKKEDPECKKIAGSEKGDEEDHVEDPEHEDEGQEEKHSGDDEHDEEEPKGEDHQPSDD